MGKNQLILKPRKYAVFDLSGDVYFLFQILSSQLCLANNTLYFDARDNNKSNQTYCMALK